MPRRSGVLQQCAHAAARAVRTRGFHTVRSTEESRCREPIAKRRLTATPSTPLTIYALSPPRFSLPESDAVVTDKAYGFHPEQKHLTYWGSPDKMLVSFASADGAVAFGHPLPLAPATMEAVVQYGPAADRLTSNRTCVTTTYVQDQFEYDGSPGYISPYLVHCLMTGEAPILGGAGGGGEGGAPPDCRRQSAASETVGRRCRRFAARRLALCLRPDPKKLPPLPAQTCRPARACFTAWGGRPLTTSARCATSPPSRPPATSP